MVWSVFTNTVAGPGFFAGDYVGASGEIISMRIDAA
jgi:hypothetical protein